MSTTLIEQSIAGTLNRPSVWFMRQAGRYMQEYQDIRANVNDFLDMCYDAPLAAEITMQPIHAFDMDAAIIFSDILVIPDALGINVHFERGRGPVVAAISETSFSSIAQNQLDLEKLRPMYQALQMVRQKLASEKTLIGFSGCPWTLATYIVEGGSSKDYRLVKQWMYSNPDSFAELIGWLTKAVICHITAQIDAGANVVQLFDSWAGVLPDWAFRRYVVDPMREIRDQIKKQHPTVPIIGFPKGAGAQIEHYVDQTKVDCVALDAVTPLSLIKEKIQPKCCVQGNLDPIILLTDKKTIKREATRLLEQLSSGRYIFNLGHGILPETPRDHIAWLVDYVKNYQAS